MQRTAVQRSAHTSYLGGPPPTLPVSRFGTHTPLAGGAHNTSGPARPTAPPGPAPPPPRLSCPPHRRLQLLSTPATPHQLVAAPSLRQPLVGPWAIEPQPGDARCSCSSAPGAVKRWAPPLRSALWHSALWHKKWQGRKKKKEKAFAAWQAHLAGCHSWAHLKAREHRQAEPFLCLPAATCAPGSTLATCTFWS